MNEKEYEKTGEDALAFLSDALTAEAFDAPKKQPRPMRWALAAAACLALALAVLGATGLLKGQKIPEKLAGNTSLPLETPAVSAEPRIVYAAAQDSMGFEEFVTSPGEVRLANSLRLALDDPEYYGCRFAVRIDVGYIASDVFEKYRTGTDIKSEPLLLAYANEQNEWINWRIWHQTDWEKETYCYETVVVKGIEPEIEFGVYMEQKFEEYWRENHTEQEFAELEAARARFEAANEAFEAFCRNPMADPVFAERYAAERERLRAAGIEIDENFNAFLTREQLLDFPVSPQNYCYEIHWIGHSDAWDE